MKTNPTSLMRVVVVLAMLGSNAIAQQEDTKSKVVIEVNGKKFQADGTNGTITIRTDGDQIEVDTDGDGKPEKQINQTDNEKVAWLGVKNSQVRPELAAQLDIEGGAVVEMVVPDSPADQAGLKDYDVITAIGKTEISGPDELATAIRKLKPGSEVAISILRKAKSETVTATLGNRPQMPQNQNPEVHDLQLNGNVDEMRDRIEKIQQEMLNGMKLRIDGVALPDIDAGNEIVRMSSKTTSFSDGDGSIKITTKDGETHIEAKDADGNVVYEGPAETEDDRKKLPPAVLKKLERFEEMNVDIDIKGFENKMLPPALDLPKLKPAKRKKQISTETKSASAS